MDGGSWVAQKAVIETIPKKKNAERQNGCDQDHPQEKECRKAKWLSEAALQITEKREVKYKGDKDIPSWMQSSKEQQGERSKPSSVINAKK